MHDPLLGAEPAQLGVVQQFPPGGAEIVEDFVDVSADEALSNPIDRKGLYVVASSDGEHQRDADQFVGVIRHEAKVCRRVVRVRVHGV